MTAAEARLWEHLRNRRLKGYKFRRQHPLLSFVADFYCHKSRLVIEVDGEIHLLADIASHDFIRTELIEDVGLRVVRFTNQEVFERLDWVLETIAQNLLTPTHYQPLLPRASRGRRGRG